MAPSLISTSDTGASSSDGITKDTTPTVTGTVAAGLKVTLYDGTKAVGSATADKVTGAYTITSSALAAGGHQLIVKTTDATGKLSDPSSALALTIDTSAPKAPVLSVATLTNDSSVTISGTGEVGAVITLTDGKTMLGTVDVLADGTFSTTATLTDGSHALTAKATDLAGNVSAASSAKTVVVDTKAPAQPLAPTLASTSDTGASKTDGITSDSTPTFTGKAEAGSTVRLFDGATVVASAVASSTGAYSITSTTLADGVHTLTVTATDKVGNVSPASPGTLVTIDTTKPATPATPTLDPASDTGNVSAHPDDVTADSTPTIDGTAEAGTTVTLYDKVKTRVGSAVADGNGNFSITSSKLADGAHSLTVAATDAAGNVSAASGALAVTIDTKAPTKPTLTLAAGSDSGASATDGITNVATPTLTGKTEANAAVAILVGQNVIVYTQADATGVYSVAFNASLADGVYTFTTQAADAAGNRSALSTAKTVTIDTTPPTRPTVNSVADGAGKKTVSGTGEVGSTISLTDNGAKVGTTVTVGSKGTWSEAITFKTTGAHDLMATATDKAGNTATSLHAMVQAMATMTPQSSTSMTPSASSSSQDHPLAAAH